LEFAELVFISANSFVVIFGVNYEYTYEEKESKNINEFEEFGKELINLLPVNNLKKVFKQFEHFDGQTPETLLAKIKSKSLKSKKTSAEEQKSFQAKLLNAIRSPEYASLIKAEYEKSVKHIKKYLEKDSRYSLLINLINKADKNVEFVSLPLLMPFLDMEKNFILFCKPIKLLEEINNSNGEKRKNFVVELFREIPEPLYYKYLETILRLSFLSEKKIFLKDTPRDFGDLVFQSANRLKDFSGLVIGEMKLLRNSFAHNNFKYDFDGDSFDIWDRNTELIKMSADEIVKIANDATLMCVVTFPLIAQLYFLRNFYLDSGLLDIYLQNIPALTSGNALETSKAENEFLAFGQLLTEPMRVFFQKHQQTYA